MAECYSMFYSGTAFEHRQAGVGLKAAVRKLCQQVSPSRKLQATALMPTVCCAWCVSCAVVSLPQLTQVGLPLVWSTCITAAWIVAWYRGAALECFCGNPNPSTPCRQVGNARNKVLGQRIALLPSNSTVSELWPFQIWAIKLLRIICACLLAHIMQLPC